MNRETRKNFLLLSALLFLFFFTWSSCTSFLPIWLDQKFKIPDSKVGWIFSAISTIAICSQPFYGFIQDKLGLKKYLLWFLGTLLFLSGPFFIYILSPLLVKNYTHGLIIGGCFIGLTFNAGIGVLESYAERISRITQFEYGHVRLWGSLGWAAATFITGQLISHHPKVSFILASISATLFLLLLAHVHISKSNAFGELEYGKTSAISVNDALGLLKLPKFWALVIFFLGVSVYNIYDQQFSTYFSRQFSSAELGNKMYGTLNSFQVFLEALGILLAPFVVNRIGAKNSLLLSGSIMAVRIIGSGLVNGAVLISAMKLLHAAELPLLLIASFKYISLNFEHRLSATIYLVGFQFITQLCASLFSPVVSYGYSAIGFAKTYLILGVIVFGFVIISSFLLQGKSRHSTHSVIPLIK